MSDLQCCAYDNFNRCKNNTVKNSYHCIKHYSTARKLYFHYKDICDLAYNLDLNKKFIDLQENIDYLLSCYEKFNNAYEARMLHRRYAFVPECYDAGHDYQFIFIKNKINECEEKIKQLEQEQIKENEITNIIIYTENEKVNKKRKQRQKIQEEEYELIEKYIKQNEKFISERKIINEFIIEYMDGIEDVYKINFKNKHLMIYFVWRLVYRLFTMNYFQKEFEPVTCECNDCDCQVPYKLEFGYLNKKEKYLQSIKQFNIHSYLNRMCLHCIKYFCDIIMENIDKLHPLIIDLHYLYKKYDNDIITMELVLIWNVTKARIELIKFDSFYFKVNKIKNIKNRLRFKADIKKQLNEPGYNYDLDLSRDFS